MEESIRQRGCNTKGEGADKRRCGLKILKMVSISNGKGMIMKKSGTKLGIVALGMLMAMAGCMTVPNDVVINTSPLSPNANEEVVLDQLLVLVDVTGSMTGSKYNFEESLVDAFTDAMPNGAYEAGIASFAGVPRDEWVNCPLQPYNRERFTNCERSLVLLGSLTPLDRAIVKLTPQMEGKGGNGALLVFSDGLVRSEASVIEACQGMIAAHGGNLCIYTVQIGNSEYGREVLASMVSTANCGQGWMGENVNNAQAIEDMVRTIFFGARPVAAVSPAAGREYILLGDVLFDYDKDVLKPEGRIEVDKVLGMLKANPNDTVIIEGHTCDLGSDAYNMDLSQRRANTVRNYSISNGIDPARITTRAYGETRPAVPNTSESNRKLNRRIVFVR